MFFSNFHLFHVIINFWSLYRNIEEPIKMRFIVVTTLHFYYYYYISNNCINTITPMAQQPITSTSHQKVLLCTEPYHK